jgi:DNA-binding transcriptional regulator YiaG
VNPMTADEMRELRMAMGLTQRQLAAALELEPAYGKDSVRAWENNKRPIAGPVRVALRLLAAPAVRKAAKTGRLADNPEGASA